MNNFLTESVFFGLVLSLSSYVVGTWLKKRFKLAVLNPLLLSIIMTILVLLITGVDYQNYYTGAKYISYLLTPATVSLAIPLYERFVAELMDQGLHVETGRFGADMQVSLINDGPVTLILDTDHMRTGRI